MSYILTTVRESYNIDSEQPASCTISASYSNYIPKGYYGFEKDVAREVSDAALGELVSGFSTAISSAAITTIGRVWVVSNVQIYYSLDESYLHGFKPQTQQGAVILAPKLKTQVFMPDVFEPFHILTLP